ncbi:hypothetical protein PRZ48_003421 [Zasmidium cellare]|uniref:Uncharacterized protein n=1 Tax=Zasmidium cellare TaxID=395010 RepID=A0ABR0EWA9_ZASCE|nr:hypothetical protein PRZ48_003421 [Zasmidium cellare]
MHAHGIEVHLTDGYKKVIEEHENKLQTEDAPKRGFLSSRLVSEWPGMRITVHLDFGRDFELHDADWVIVRLASGVMWNYSLDYASQTFCIHRTELDSRRKFSFDHIKIFTATRGLRQPLQIPTYSTTRNAISASISPETGADMTSSCITVFVSRGYATDELVFESRGLSESLDIGLIISKGFPRLLDGDRGESMIFQFKNIREQNIPKPRPAAREKYASSMPANDPVPAVITSGRRNGQLTEPNITAASLKPKRKLPNISYSQHHRVQRTAPPKRKAVGPNGKRTSKVTGTSKAKSACWTSDDDQDDDEVLPPPAAADADHLEIKQEDNAQSVVDLTEETPTQQGTPQRRGRTTAENKHTAKQKEAGVKGESSQVTSMSPQTTGDMDMDDDEELLRLQLEENRLMQRMRKKELQRTAKR